jgi:hypothetical protein
MHVDGGDDDEVWKRQKIEINYKLILQKETSDSLMNI